jgi:uncharacterized protein YqeY
MTEQDVHDLVTEAIKNGDTDGANALRSVLQNIEKARKAKRCKKGGDDVDAAIRDAYKTTCEERDSIRDAIASEEARMTSLDDTARAHAQATLKKRQRRLATVEHQRETIERILPPEPETLTDDEVKTLVKAAIAQTGATTMRDMCRVMQTVQTLANGATFDRKLAADTVKARLNNA